MRLAGVLDEFRLTFKYTDAPEGYRKVYIRMHSIERSELQKLIQDLSTKATLHYMVDRRENNREIFAQKID